MEQTLLESFKIAPALVALVVVVYLFIKAQQWLIKHTEESGKERTQTFMTAAKEREVLFVETMKEIHKEHIEQRARSLLVMERTANVNQELAQTLGKVQIALMECAECHRRAASRGAA